MEEVLIALIIFSTIFGVIYMYLTTRNKERMALIERGETAQIFQSGPTRNRLMSWTLRIGIMCIGVALGIFLGAAIDSAGWIEEGVAYPSLIFLCAGGALVSAYFIERAIIKKDREDSMNDWPTTRHQSQRIQETEEAKAEL